MSTSFRFSSQLMWFLLCASWLSNAWFSSLKIPPPHHLTTQKYTIKMQELFRNQEESRESCLIDSLFRPSHWTKTRYKHFCTFLLLFLLLICPRRAWFYDNDLLLFVSQNITFGNSNWRSFLQAHDINFRTVSAKPKHKLLCFALFEYESLIKPQKANSIPKLQ